MLALQELKQLVAGAPAGLETVARVTIVVSHSDLVAIVTV